MNNKILAISLILLTALFLWQYLHTTESKPASVAYNSPNKDKSRNKIKILTTPSQSILAANKISNATKNPTEKYLSQIEINEVLEALKKVKGNEGLNSLALAWKQNPCPECLGSLKQIVLNRKLDKGLRTNAALLLAKIGTRESVVALMQSLSKKISSASEKKLLEIIASEAISTISETKGVGTLAYILTDQQGGIIANRLPAPLIRDMNNAIESFADKKSLAYEITKQYWGSKNPDVQKSIIELNHPQTLASLVVDAEELGDITLQKVALGKLASNPSSNSLDALMSLSAKGLGQNSELLAKIDEWTQSYIQTDRQGHLIDYLSNPSFSTGQREIAVEALTKLSQTPNMLSEQENFQIQDALNKFTSGNVASIK